jgi:hypothetical protein
LSLQTRREPLDEAGGLLQVARQALIDQALGKLGAVSAGEELGRGPAH